MGGSAFIGGRLRHIRKGSGVVSVPSIRAPVAFHQSHTIDGQRKGKSVGEERKEDDGRMRLTSGTSYAAGERREGAATWALRATVPRWAALVGWLGGEGRPS